MKKAKQELSQDFKTDSQFFPFGDLHRRPLTGKGWVGWWGRGGGDGKGKGMFYKVWHPVDDYWGTGEGRMSYITVRAALTETDRSCHRSAFLPH